MNEMATLQAEEPVEADEGPVIAFAFGCFQFGLGRATPVGWTVGAYISELTSTLRSISAVDHVSVDVPPDALEEEIGEMGPLDIGNGEPAFPFLRFGAIRLDLVIPHGVQHDLFARPPRTFTERFEVTIDYQYRMPIAVVRLVEPSQRPDPSTAVVIIRRLFEREFSRLAGGIVRFQCLGPSPMHADFYLAAASHSPSASEPFALRLVRQRAYDDFEFLYDASTFSDMEDAFSALLSELTAEADVFFFVQQIYAGRLHGWMALQDMGASVVDLQRGTGLRGWVNRTFRTSGRLNSALIELAGFETNRVLADEAVRSDYVDTYSADNRPFLRELVDAAREELPGFPTDQITGLLRLFETRRLSGLQVNALLVSGITGGVIGALIAALFH